MKMFFTFSESKQFNIHTWQCVVFVHMHIPPPSTIVNCEVSSCGFDGLFGFSYKYNTK